MSEIERNKAVARKFFADMSSGNIQGVVDAYAADGRVHTMGQTLISGVFGVDVIKQFAGQVLGSFPQGITFTILHMTAEDDRVAIEAESSGMHVSGRLYENQYHFLMRVRDGKVVDFKEYMDTEKVTDILCGGQRPPQGTAAQA
jgi:ketosteroid isomerase-like protein